MRKVLLMMLCLLFGHQALALEGVQVEYVGGTSPIVKSGLVGRFDVTPVDDLAFDASGGNLRITYSSIDHYEFRVEMAHHLGVLPTIAVGLVNKRMHRRLVTIDYRDASGNRQVAEFEVGSKVPDILLPVLAARVPKSAARTISDRPNPFR